MRLSTELRLPLTGLTGFETPLGEEEQAIQQTVHRFARDVLRPLGEELDKMSAEQVVAPGSPYYSVFAEAAKLGLDRQTVGKWRRRFMEQRVAGLHDEPRSGAPRTACRDAPGQHDRRARKPAAARPMPQVA